MGSYKIIRDDGTEREFDGREEFDEICRLLDDAGEDYETEGASEPQTDGGTATVVESEAGAESPQPQSSESDIESEEEFVTEIAGVPPAFVISMRGSPYITKSGLNYIANKKGLQVRSEPIAPSWEGNDIVAYKGIVENDHGDVWTDIGTAHKGKETIGDEHLDELASTRATNRALRLATGMGLTSIEELSEDGVDENGAEVIESEVTD